MSEAGLLFVYGNDSGAVNGLIHFVHKIVSPSTYDCRLCGLTYGPLGQRAAWSRALGELGRPSEFLHRDELAKHYPDHQVALPAVFSVVDGQLTPLVTKDEIDGCRDLDAFIVLVRARTGASRTSTAASVFPPSEPQPQGRTRQ
jgi:hypothetical protein